MAKTTNVFSLTMTATEDSSQNVPINRTSINSFDSSLAEFQYYGAIPLPNLVIQVPSNLSITELYIKNLDTTKSIFVSWTVLGNLGPGLVEVIQLNPGDWIAFSCNPTGTPAAPGVSTITLVASAAGALFEMFIGG